jgi:hypothetical protein
MEVIIRPKTCRKEPRNIGHLGPIVSDIFPATRPYGPVSTMVMELPEDAYKKEQHE